MDPYAAHIDHRRSQILAEADTRRLLSTAPRSPASLAYPTRGRVRKALIAAIVAAILAAGVVTASGPPTGGTPHGAGGGGVRIYDR